MNKKKQKLPLDYAICNLAVVPIRKRPEDQSELVSQLLFGECVQILLKKNKSWLKVICHLDGYEGWIDPKQVYLLTKHEYLHYSARVSVAIDVLQQLINQKTSFPILLGSSLPMFDGMTFRMPDGKYIYNGQAINPEKVQISSDLLVKIARKFLHSPYLWGGRSIFGIDCSGFIQVVFKAIGYALPRDAYLQAGEGTIVDFVALAREGDLAFFEGETGRIIHVGLILQDGEIIHASGQVRIDRLDHEGIYNREIKKYTHRLKYIKRIIDFPTLNASRP